MRINIRRTKSLIWFLNFLALLVVSGSFWYIFDQKKRGAFVPRNEWQEIFERSMKMATAPVEEASHVRPDDFYRAIASLKLTGERQRPAETVASAVENEAPEVPSSPINEVLALEMVAAPILCAVRYLKPDDSAMAQIDDQYLRPGSLLAPPYSEPPINAKVVRIVSEDGSDYVVFSWEGQEVRVDLGAEKLASEGGPAGPGSPEDDRYSEPVDQTISLEGGARWVISTSEQEEWASNHKSIFEGERLRVQSRARPDGKAELVLKHFSSNGKIASYGFRVGDVIISINGHAVSKKAQAVNYVKAHPDEPSYTVEFSRLGRTMTKTFHVPKNKK